MCSIFPCFSSPVDEQFIIEMQKIIDEHILLIPIQYMDERKRIVDEMQRTSPQRYQGLLFADYPTINGPQVNALARKYVTANQVKHNITHQVYERLKPTIESKTTSLNPVARWFAMKTIKKAIQVAVCQAVDAVVLNDNDTPIAATTSKQ